MKNKKIVVFDFDGTLTTRDSFIKFAQYSVGIAGLLRAILSNAVYLAAWKCGIMAGGRAKEKLFASLYAGRTHDWLLSHGELFASHIASFERTDIVRALDEHISKGDLIYIVSASMPEWITAWAARHSVPADHVIGTLCEVNNDGIITGRFASCNCYGPEKVNRLRQAVGDLSSYHITAYGDSNGDKEMFATADTAIKV